MKTSLLFLMTAGVVMVLSAPGPCQTILYEEQFTGGIAWLVWLPGFGGDTLKVHAMPGNPSGDGWVGRLNNQTSEVDAGLSFAGAPDLADYSLEAWVYCPVGISEYHGIQMRIDSSVNSGYQLLADFDADRRLRFRYMVGVTPNVIHDFTASEIPGGVPDESGWHRLKMTAIGSNFWLYWDDQELPDCPYVDSSAQAGFFGLHVWNFWGEANLYCDDIVVMEAEVTGIEGRAERATARPERFTLAPNYPNPFNAGTVIGYGLPHDARVELAVYNVCGQRVRTLVDGIRPPGHHRARWDGAGEDGRPLASGLYVCRMRAGGFTGTRKMILLR
jgi:hypothetical protein